VSRIVQPSSGEISRAAEMLRAGGLVAFPTETVYGLGAHAFDERAVARIFDVKGRPRFDPLIVHVASREELARLVVDVPPAAWKLADRFWPGPLTLVLGKHADVPDLVTAGCPTVAVRIPDHEVALALLLAADLPVAAPSANLFGRISPTTAAHVLEQLGDSVDLILDGGPCRVGVESTVVQVTASGAVLLRPGGTPLEEIEAAIGKVTVPPALPVAENAALLSPGTLPQHYAPRTPLTLLGVAGDLSAVLDSQDGRTKSAPLRVGLLSFANPAVRESLAMIEVLSPSGDLCEAAANFFAALRRLDAGGLDLIVAEMFPEQGLGRALNDRLRRAAHR
jgi:L-threonylcarbamoyladenylate synthase